MDEKFHPLLSDNIKIEIDKLLKNYFLNVVINCTTVKKETLAQKEENLKNKIISTSQKTFLTDDGVLELQKIFAVRFENKDIKLLS